MRKAIPNRIDTSLSKKIFSVYSNYITMRQWKETVMPRHIGVNDSSLFDQTNCPIVTETTTHKQEVVVPVKQCQFFAYYTSITIGGVVFTREQNSTSPPSAIAVEL